MSHDQNPAARRLVEAFDCYRVGVEMMRQNLRRRHPDAESGEIESRLRSWLRERPGAEHGDAIGRVVDGSRSGWTT